MIDNPKPKPTNLYSLRVGGACNFLLLFLPFCSWFSLLPQEQEDAWPIPRPPMSGGGGRLNNTLAYPSSKVRLGRENMWLLSIKSEGKLFFVGLR